MITKAIERVGEVCGNLLEWMMINLAPIAIVFVLFVFCPCAMYYAARGPRTPDRGLCLAGHQERVVVNTAQMVWAGRTVIMVPAVRVDVEWVCQKWERP